MDHAKKIPLPNCALIHPVFKPDFMLSYYVRNKPRPK